MSRRNVFSPQPIVETGPASLMLQISEQGDYDSPVRHSQDVALQIFNCRNDREIAIQMVREWLEDVTRVGFFDPEAVPSVTGGAA